MEYNYRYDLGFASYYIVEKNKRIVSLSEKLDYPDSLTLETDLIEKTYLELGEYLAGDRKNFTIPIDFKGTGFQEEVWRELLRIPYGETRSYKDIARKIDREGAYRAVGNANRRNPILILIPCHRVIGSDGSLGGYAGGLDMKRELLKIEKSL